MTRKKISKKKRRATYIAACKAVKEKSIEEWRTSPKRKSSKLTAAEEIRAGIDSSQTVERKLIARWSREWKLLNRVNCYWCKDLLSASSCQRSYIVPISKGGAHCLSNLVISCKRCICRRRGKTPSEWAAVIYHLRSELQKDMGTKKTQMPPRTHATK